MSGKTNVTIAVPAGSILYGNQLCSPPSWTNVLTFYLANYVTHVGTVQLYPGEHGVSKWLAMIAALLFPVAGLGRGLDRIIRRVRFGKNKLEKAARASALCMVVRDSNWQPHPADSLLDVASRSAPIVADAVQKVFHTAAGTSQWGVAIAAAARPYLGYRGPIKLSYDEGNTPSQRSVKLDVYTPSWLSESCTWWNYFGIGTERIEVARKFYGSIQHRISDRLEDGLPPGYTLAYVPYDAIVESLNPQSPSVTTSARRSKSLCPEDNISSSSDSLSILSAVVQLLFGLSTLYNSIGPQINHFGYAAFGLTVFQYSLMSLVNLLAALVCPAYPSVYMVASAVMHEAIARGAVFEGMVGLVHAEHRADSIDSRRTSYRSLRVRPDDASHDAPAADELRIEAAVAVPPEEKTIEPVNAEVSSMSESDAGNVRNAASNLRCEHNQIEVFTLSAYLENISPLLGRRELQDRMSMLQQDGTSDQVLVPSHSAIERYRQPGDINISSHITVWICLVVGSCPLIPMGLLSGFKAQNSTYSQRVIIMLWFACSVCFGPLLAQMESDSQDTLRMNEQEKWMRRETVRPRVSREASADYKGAGSKVYLYTLCVYGAPAFAGLAMVGIMFVSFGDCITVS